ncbi:MAG: hypothetical protein V3S89_15865 [Desulfobacterales bacterium]
MDPRSEDVAIVKRLDTHQLIFAAVLALIILSLIAYRALFFFD